MRRSFAAAVMVLVLAACGIAGSPPSSIGDGASATPPPAQGGSTPPAPSDESPTPVAWDGHPADGLAMVGNVSDDDPKTQAFVIEPDGSQRWITGVSGGLGASRPVWSPDGSQIAFGGPKVGEIGIFGQLGIVNADGSGERKIAEGQDPQWSPDGTRIAYHEVDDVTSEELSMYVVDVTSGEITDLGIGFSTRWLGDGERLAFKANSFAADGTVSTALYVMTLETGEVEELAEWTDAYPSPDRSMMLLVREAVISLASGDGSGGRQLVNGGDPVWSPDGTRFTYVYDHDADANPIHAIADLDGLTILSDIVGSTPTWSPDGTRLAVEVYRAEGPVVQVIDIASGEVVWEVEGMHPAWRPMTAA